MKLKYKNAIKKLLKGETLFHESPDGFNSVKMTDGKLKCIETDQEWSFSDFNSFYSTKKDIKKTIKINK